MPTFYTKICQHCTKEFQVLPREKTKKFCSQQCFKDSIAVPKDQPIECPTCGKTFNSYKHNNILKFCSRTCANVRNYSTETKEKISLTLRKFYADNPVSRKTRPSTTCIVCGKLTNHPTRKTCSKECYTALITVNSQKHPNCGGQKHTHRTKITNILNTEFVMESSYEVSVAQSLNNNNILWIRPEYFIYVDSHGHKRRYYPDFYLPEYGIYLDPKK